MSTTSTPTSAAAGIADDVAQVLLSVVPALAPYGATIEVAFIALATLAPELWTEIKTIIAQIKGGTAPTADQIAQLQTLVAQLQTPDNYFGAPAPAAPVL